MGAANRIASGVRIGFVLSVLIVSPLAHSSRAQSEPDSVALVRDAFFDDLTRLADSLPGTFSFVIQEVGAREGFSYNALEPYPQASAIKIPILVELHRAFQSGSLSPGERVTIESSDQVGGTGVLGLFSDGASQVSLSDLGVLMIVLSDNTATNLLIDRIGMDAINANLEGVWPFRFEHLSLQRKMMDFAAREAGRENSGAPIEIDAYLRALYDDRVIQGEEKDEILRILRLPKPGGPLPGLPPGAVAAWKSGQLPGVRTLWAIIEIDGVAFALTAMGKEGNEQAFEDAISHIVAASCVYFERWAARQ